MTAGLRLHDVYLKSREDLPQVTRGLSESYDNEIPMMQAYTTGQAYPFLLVPLLSATLPDMPTQTQGGR